MSMFNTFRVCYSQKFIPRLKFLYLRSYFLQASVCKSGFGQKSPMAYMKSVKNGAYPPVYIASRIEGLSSTIKNLSSGICHELTLNEINLPDESDVLLPSSIQELQDASIVIIDPKRLAHNYKNMPKLEWAHCTWAGIEPLFEIMNEKPDFILTRHAETDFCLQMAEYVSAQMLILEKNYRSMWAAEMEKSWSKMQASVLNTSRNRLLKDLTLGILGVGNMGQAIAEFFKTHGTKVIGLSRKPRKQDEFGFFDKIVVSLSEVLSVSDYVVNTLPSTPETVGLLDGNVLEACTKMPVFINVGRGSIIKENTLLKALENKWLSHIVLDVFQKEPLPADSQLWNARNQITITPHIAALSEPKNIAKDFLSSFLCYLEKKPLKNVVDWEKGY